MTIRKLSIFGLAALLLLGACATKPPAAPEPVAIAPVEPAPAPKAPEISKEELDALHGRVLALRKEAFGLGLKDLMAAEYSVAETRYVAGKTALDADDRPTARTELGAAEPLFADLVAKGAVKVAGMRKADASAARDRAMKEDAGNLSADSLAVADALLAAGNTALAAGDAKAAIAAYTNAATAFDAVEKRSTVVTVRNRVDELLFGPMDSGNYELAGRKFAAVDTLLATDPDAAGDSAAEALLRYRLVLAKGWELVAGGKRDDAQRYKTDSEGIKAQVAVKGAYAEAKAVWDTAAAAYASGNHEAAAALFEQARSLFMTVYEEAAAKRSAAQEAIAAAAAKNQESETIAMQGDVTIEASAASGKE
jgi:hypothetical protein